MATQRAALGWRQAVEPWYFACALFGIVIGGVVPLLVPQRVILAEGSPAHVGVVMAVIGLGGLTSALWAGLADRFRWHRVLFAGGLVAGAVALGAFPVAPGVAAWVALALVFGVGAGAANTVANLFVVEAHPQDEWDARISRLQAFYNGGAVLGLVLAGGLSHLPLAEATGLDVGLVAGAGITMLAAVLGWSMTRVPPRPATPTPVRPRPGPHPEWVASAPPRLLHLPTPESLRRLGAAVRSRFALLQVIWILGNLGPNAVYALYPLLMEDVFGIEPGPASLIMAVGLWLGLAVYSPAGRLGDRLGEARVLQLGLGLRLAGLLALLGLGLVAVAGGDWLAAVSFTIVTLTFPLLSVSSAALTSRLSPLGPGEGLGIYNSAGQVAGLLGPLLGGFAAQWAGYNAVLAVAVASIAVSLVLTVLLGSVRHEEPYVRGARPNTAS